MDLKYIEKRLFTYILLVSSLVALIVLLANALLTLCNHYFLGIGFSQQQLAMSNVGIIGILIVINAAVISTCLKGFFQTKKKALSMEAIPKMVTMCLSEFIQGYREHEA